MTNECVDSDEDCTEIRRDVNFNLRHITNDLCFSGNTSIINETGTIGGPTDPSECNHGELVNGTCACEEGWQTAPGQDRFNYVWCNASKYDEEWYGESDLRENKLIAYKLFIACICLSFATAFMLQSMFQIAAWCCKSRRKQKRKKKKSKRKHGKSRKRAVSSQHHCGHVADKDDGSE